MAYFSDLAVGDVFRVAHPKNHNNFIKLTSGEDDKRLDEQFPNCMCLSNNHYCVVSNKMEVVRIKGIKDFEPYSECLDCEV